MIKATIDFNKSTGVVKPMHGVNNGPIYKPNAVTQNMQNMKEYMEAGFPFARTHDSAFCAAYGGPHTIDVLNIFTDMDKDPYDENNYDFICTDAYIQAILASGAQVIYRLGTSIEHGVKKYGCKPPKDYHKYAVVCEHIIKHYTEGWANGFNYDIKYWEIWNEPDTHVDGLAHPEDPSWTGTPQQFFDFFNVMYNHLKKCFPHLMIGGPAAGGPWRQWVDDFLASVESDTLDFFSWHSYTDNPRNYVKYAKIVKEKLEAHGYKNTLTMLGEWNYAKGWLGQDFVDTILHVKGIKGASFSVAAMSCCQYADVDVLLYYDARPSGFNGIFSTDVCSIVLKGYYPFYNFNKLYKIGQSSTVECENEDIYLCGAYADGKGGVLITHFNNDDNTETKCVDLSLDTEGGEYKIKYYLLDGGHDNEMVKEEIINGKQLKIKLDMPLFTCYYLEIEKIV